MIIPCADNTEYEINEKSFSLTEGLTFSKCELLKNYTEEDIIDFIQYGFEISSLESGNGSIKRFTRETMADCQFYKPGDDIQHIIFSIMQENIASKIQKYNADNIYLLLSAGKDSLFILYVLDKMGLARKVKYVTLKGYHEKSDEAELVGHILKRYNPEHIIIPYEIPDFDQASGYFGRLKRPNSDHISFVYPKFAQYIPHGSLIMDGMGNDVYIGHMPSLTSVRNFYINEVLKRFHLNKKESHEMIGLKGYSDFKKNVDIHHGISYALSETYESYRSRVRGGYLDMEVFMWKTVLFADSVNSHAFFPWSNSKICSYVKSIPPKKRYKIGKNKLILRSFLENYFDINFDLLGKRGFSVDQALIDKFCVDDYINLHTKIKDIVSYEDMKHHSKLIKNRIFMLNCWLCG